MSEVNYSILCFSSFEELKNIKSEWDELYEFSEVDAHYLTFEFVHLWYCCFATPGQIRIFRIVAAGRTIAFLPLRLKASKGLRTLASLTNHHCPHSGPLARMGYEAAFQTGLLQALFQQRPNWDILTFGYSYDFDRFPGLLAGDKLDSEQISWLRTSQPTYSIYLNLDFEAWAKQNLSKKTYKTFKDLKNKYKKASSWSLKQFSGHEAIAKWDIFLELENSGWKGARESSIKKLPEQYQRYYQGLVQQLADQGKLTISLLEYENQYIAGAFMYQEGDIVHMMKAGFNEDFRFLSPSNMLLMETVRVLSEQQGAGKMLHMFPGDFGYKDRYATTDIKSSFTLIFNRTLRGQAAYRYRQFKNLVKARLQNKNSP